MTDAILHLLGIGIAHADNFRILTGVPGPVDPNAGGILGTLQNLYLLALGLAGLLALGSVAYGAVLYTLSPGNPSKLSDAWDRIVQALVGVLLLVGAGTILTAVNPGLLSVELPRLQPVAGVRYEAVTPGSPVFDRTDTEGNPIKASGKDLQCKTGPQEDPKNACYIGNFQGNCGWNAEVMSRMCKQESAGGQTGIISSCDVCEDGSGFSVGLLQINLLAHGQPGSPIYNDLPRQCQGLFDGSLARSQRLRPNAPSVCPYRKCSLKADRKADFKACLSFITTNLPKHLELSCKLFNQRPAGAKKYCDWPHSYNVCISGTKTC